MAIKKSQQIFPKKKVTKTVQQTIPYEMVYPDGMIMLEPGQFSKSYFFGDVNFSIEPEQKQENIIKKYEKLLSRFNHNTTFQITIFNRKTEQAKLEEKFFLKAKAKEYQDYQDEYNEIIANRIKEGRNDIQKERYLTVTVKAADVIAAKKIFTTLDLEITQAVREINKTGVKPLTIEERLMILHDIFRMNAKERFPEILDQYKDESGKFSLEVLEKNGLTTKGLIAPDTIVCDNLMLRLMEDCVAKTFVITNFPTSLDTSFLSEITNIPCSMLTTVSFWMEPRKSMVKRVRLMNNAIKSEVMKSNRAAIKGQYDPNLISEELQNAKDEASYLTKDVIFNNQKTLFVTLTITLLADNAEQMKEFCNILKMRTSDFMCQLNALYGQQLLGFKSSLPLGRSYLEIDRLMTAESACAMFPFSVQELMDTNGYFCGLNAVTKNMIIYDRKNSSLPNGMIFGKSGSGKSYYAKGAMIPVLLGTEDDIIVLDPDGEYVALAEEFGGTVISLTQGNNQNPHEPHINPLDLDINYADDNEDPVAIKCDYLVSMCESILGKHDPLSSYEVNTIHKCGKLIYEDYMKHMEKLKEAGSAVTCDYEAAPTLATFYNTLLDMDGPEAHRLALAIEPYCVGSYDTFSHRTNINPNTRFLVYDLRKMPTKMKNFAMMVCLNDIWNRVVRNKDAHKATWVYLDEFYHLVQTESAAIMLQMFWKRIRKYYGIMTGITQDAEDVLVTPEGRSMLNNSSFIIMMNQSQIGRAELQQLYDISPALLDYIKDKPPGIGLLYNGSTTIPFSYEMPADTKLHKLMSTKPSES